MEIPINLYIIVFDNHFPFQKSIFRHSKYILGDKLDNYAQKNLKKKNIYIYIYFAKKKGGGVFLPENAYFHFCLSILLFGK